jgi:hypothetical protein
VETQIQSPSQRIYCARSATGSAANGQYNYTFFFAFIDTDSTQLSSIVLHNVYHSKSSKQRDSAAMHSRYMPAINGHYHVSTKHRRKRLISRNLWGSILLAIVLWHPIQNMDVPVGHGARAASRGCWLHRTFTASHRPIQFQLLSCVSDSFDGRNKEHILIYR